MNEKLRIGITDCGKYENYQRWIESSGIAEAVKLGADLDNADAVAGCDGVLISGGEDVEPGLYGKPEYVKDFDLREIIPERDRFELSVIKKVLDQQRPLLGICRGLQIVNVYLGGTLIPDIPSVLKRQGHSKIAGVDQVHPVTIAPGSLLEQVSGVDSGLVNSAHHQSVDQAAKDLSVTATSDPDVVEALEWTNPDAHAWLLLVQWHPERMLDLTDPLTRQIRKAFLEASRFRKDA